MICNNQRPNYILRQEISRRVHSRTKKYAVFQAAVRKSSVTLVEFDATELTKTDSLSNTYRDTDNTAIELGLVSTLRVRSALRNSQIELLQ